MQRFNLDKFNHKAMIAISIPIALVCWYQFGFIALGIISILILGIYPYKLYQRLENTIWHQQLNCVVEKMTAAVLIADRDHCIIYANENFHRLPLAGQVALTKKLPAFLENDQGQNHDHITQMLNSLKSKLKGKLLTENETYEWLIIPLFSSTGKRKGTLVEYTLKTEYLLNEETKRLKAQQKEIACIFSSQSHQPLALVDTEGNSQSVNTALLEFVYRTSSIEQEVAKQWQEGNFINHLHPFAPRIATRLKKAMSYNNATTFIDEYEGTLSDWIITPIKKYQSVLGYSVEIIIPSRQTIQALDDNLLESQNKISSMENELAKLMCGLSNLLLYHRDMNVNDIQLNSVEFHHPLLINAAKMLQQLRECIQKLYTQINTLRTECASKGELLQNILSDSMAKLVHDIQDDFSLCENELQKMKSLTNEQNGLTQSYALPLGKIFQSTEQTLFQSMHYCEAVTVVLENLHENQEIIVKLRNLMENVSVLPGNIVIAESGEISQEIVELLDILRQVFHTSKDKLHQVILDFDGLQGGWNESLENIKICLDQNAMIAQITSKLNSMNLNVHEFRHDLGLKFSRLLEMSNNATAKTTVASLKIFEQVALEIDENKKQAEDVLLEGL